MVDPPEDNCFIHPCDRSLPCPPDRLPLAFWPCWPQGVIVISSPVCLRGPLSCRDLLQRQCCCTSSNKHLQVVAA